MASWTLDEPGGRFRGPRGMWTMIDYVLLGGLSRLAFAIVRGVL